MPGWLSVVEGCFFFTFSHFLLLGFTFFTTRNLVNYFLLLKGARWVILIYFLIYLLGEGVHLFFSQKIKYFGGNQIIGQRIKSFWANIGQNLFFFRAIIGTVNNTLASKNFGQRIISF